MQKLKVLYVASEVNPFLQTSRMADMVRKIPEAMQEKGMEIRIFVPRFGLINERKNRLHEVVRLSGINISVGDEEKPLVIKVASIPNAKMQVYFIDNEDYFQRKSVFHDENKEFHKDNHERAVFFCKGTLETTKKLAWVPNIIHCNDWMTSLIPLYLKTTYKDEPLFQNTKTVFSVYDDGYFSHKFDNSDLFEKIKTLHVDDESLKPLEASNYEGFIKLGIEHSDVVIKNGEELNSSMKKMFEEIEESEKMISMANGDSHHESFFNIYNELVQ